MNKVGDKVRRVHPLRFIGFILSDPYLRICLKNIESDVIKWANFMEGYEARMAKESREDNLLKYLPGFAELLEVSESSIQHFIQNEDYSGLVRYFL